MLNIVQAPNPVLSGHAKKINKIDKTITDLIQEMVITLVQTTDPEGVGLAAPQVGKSLQLFIIKEAPQAPLYVFINPEILTKSEKEHELADIDSKKKKKKGVKLEGCLSVKDIWGVVHRSESVKVSYLDEHGEKHTKTFKGFLATIVQHECDHLQGILFPKRVLEQKGKLYRAEADEQGEMLFEEMGI